ncbi:cytochrome P450 [Lepidopterella palustris CBS 459.81]|uniref:Cytochrome P450 n=1 Tax=Lepidopterella palustris CBS 459.81 TaxID=1314670 RepID=A0A8E2E0N9_9PEZI|nr:cytochrome P450 [Lepidopterella palustris CBS 459.81]
MDLLVNVIHRLITSPLFLLSVLLSSLAILLVIIYRLTLHPLSRYPGPFLARITDIHLAYHAWKGDRHLELWRSHLKYGSIVRVGPNDLSINTVSGLKTIYGFRANVRKSDFYTAFPANKNTYNTHSSIDKTVHARKRRVLSHAFSDSAVKSLERYILANVRTACRILGERAHEGGNGGMTVGDGVEKKWTQGLNMANWCNWLVFDIMGDLVFGKAFGMLESPTNRFAVDLVGKAAHRHLICGTHLTIHKYHLDKLLFPKIAATRAQYMQYSRTQAASRTKLGLDIDRQDFFFHLLNARDPETGQGFSNNELWGESNLLIIAGSDTTSTAMAATFFYLVHNPLTLAKLTQEVREAFSSVEDIVFGPTLSGCAYLRACIDEAMRMTPPVPGSLPRAVLSGGIEVDGHHIPAGAVVGVPTYAIHHNSDYYPRPFDYIPERWLASPPPPTPTPTSSSCPQISSPNPFPSHLPTAHSAFCPFSIGPRGCIGKGLAYVELTLTIARVLWLFDVRLSPGTTLGEGRVGAEVGRERTGEFQIQDRFASWKDGPVMEFRSREGAGVGD